MVCSPELKQCETNEPLSVPQARPVILTGDKPEKVGIDVRDYRHLLALEKRWTEIEAPRFRQAGFVSRLLRWSR